MRSAIKSVQFRRKREGKTNYKKRLRLILSGKPRLVVRPTLAGMIAQVIAVGDKGDVVLASANSKDLKKIGWNYNAGNIPSAYLTGMLAAKNALKKNVREAILDIGLRNPVKGARVFACLKGAVDAGLKIPFSEEVLPSPDRIKGEHIAKHAELAKKNADVKSLPKVFEEIKNKILKM